MSDWRDEQFYVAERSDRSGGIWVVPVGVLDEEMRRLQQRERDLIAAGDALHGRAKKLADAIDHAGDVRDELEGAEPDEETVITLVEEQTVALAEVRVPLTAWHRTAHP